MPTKEEVDAAIAALEASTSTLDKWVLGFVFLVAVGVIGELVFGFIHWRKDVELHDLREIQSQLNDGVIAKLNNDTARLSGEAETLRKKNLEFEAAVSPRVLEQGLSAKILSQFGAVPFVVVAPPDFEPKRTAGQIRWMLLQANWVTFAGPIWMRFAFFDGVVIHIMGFRAAANDPAQSAADRLVSILRDNGIEARIGAPFPLVDEQGKPVIPSLPQFQPTKPSVLIVEVGPKPLPASLQMKPENVPADASGNKIWGNIAE